MARFRPAHTTWAVWLLLAVVVLLSYTRSSPKNDARKRHTLNCMSALVSPAKAADASVGPVVGDVSTYSSRGIELVQQVELPDGKRTVLDTVNPLPVVDEAPPDAQLVAGQLLDRLLSGLAPVDLLTALLLLCSLGLGLIDTPRRWIDYAAEALAWTLHGLQPGAVVPAKRVTGDVEDVEKVRAARAAARRLACDLASMRQPAERMRLDVAAARAAAADPLLLPLTRSLRAAAAAGLPQVDPPPRGQDGLAPARILDGEWECLCDYRMDGRPMKVLMRIDGSSGSYFADGAMHRLVDISARKCSWADDKDSEQQPVYEFSFRWENSKEADRGRGSWLASADGDCLDGTWTCDSQPGGPWTWSGVKKKTPAAGVPLARQSLPARERVDLEDSAARAVAEVIASTLGQPASAREALARAWEDAAPQGFFWGVFSKQAALPRRWAEVGTELRMLLGLSAEGLIHKELRTFAWFLTVGLFGIVSALLARVLTIAVGSHTDAATWAFFGAAYAAVLDFTRRESLAQALRPESEADQQSRVARLAAFRRWADAGNLYRHGETPREKVLEAVRRGIPEIRMADAAGELGAGELERLVEAWHPGLRRRFERSGADMALPGEDPAAFRRRQQEAKQSPVLVIYENLSIPDSVGQGVWR